MRSFGERGNRSTFGLPIGKTRTERYAERAGSKTSHQLHGLPTTPLPARLYRSHHILDQQTAGARASKIESATAAIESRRASASVCALECPANSSHGASMTPVALSLLATRDSQALTGELVNPEDFPIRGTVGNQVVGTDNCQRLRAAPTPAGQRSWPLSCLPLTASSSC